MDRNMISPNKSKSLDQCSVPNAEQFLNTEYVSLNKWAVHGEEVAHRIFSFYVTLLTAVFGGILLVAQALSSNTQTLLIILAGACGFLILMGVVFFDGLVSQYIRNAYYHIGMQSIRDHFRHYPEVATSLLEPPFFFSATKKGKPNSPVAHRWILVKFGFPGGNQLTLIEVINSLLVATLVLSIVWSIGGLGFRVLESIFGAVACACLSLVAHRVLDNLMVKRNMAQLQSGLGSKALDQVELSDGSVPPAEQKVNNEPNRSGDEDS